MNPPGPLSRRGDDVMVAEPGHRPVCLGSDPSSILTPGWLGDSPGPRFPHLWHGAGDSAGRKVESCQHTAAPVVSDRLQGQLSQHWECLSGLQQTDPHCGLIPRLTGVFAPVCQGATQL